MVLVIFFTPLYKIVRYGLLNTLFSSYHSHTFFEWCSHVYHAFFICCRVLYNHVSLIGMCPSTLWINFIKGCEVMKLISIMDMKINLCKGLTGILLLILPTVSLIDSYFHAMLWVADKNIDILILIVIVQFLHRSHK